MSCSRQDQLLLSAAEALKQAAQQLENSIKSPTSPNLVVAETKGWQDWQITCLFYMVALQTFIMLYVFTWLHFPRMLNNQVATMAKTCERVSLYILGSPEVRLTVLFYASSQLFLMHGTSWRNMNKLLSLHFYYE